MATSFHKFAELPTELRDMVWKLALRPDILGVHLFKIQNSTTRPLDKNIAVTPNSTISNVTAAPTPYPPGSIHGTPGDICSWWQAGNTLTYHVDRGLWDACEESKFIVEHETSHMVEIRFVVSSDTNRFYMVQPSQDLFIYRFHDNPFRYPYMMHMPLRFPNNPTLQPHHVGLEFHSHPAFQTGSRYCQQQQDPSENEIATFHSSKRRLVEVKLDTGARGWGDWEELRNTGGSSNVPASIQVVRQLNQNLKIHRNIELKAWKKIGLLGWEQP
ncbi:hypothetical protein FGRMN_1725 [Fusarium graminum]|nr:hypothetical protein FGRMN_1725 [Fusarium graminum]